MPFRVVAALGGAFPGACREWRSAGKLDGVFSVEALATIPLYATADLLLTFAPRDKHWWEYLDQIWGAAEAAESTSLAVLPALMLRARKASASREGR